MAEPEIRGHWSHLVDGLQASPQEFYGNVEVAIKERQVPGATICRVTHKESGILSASREYLRVVRYEFAFDVCGAPFGRGFFVSWWLTVRKGCLAQLPVLGPLFWPDTYFSIDTGLMFQAAISDAVHEALSGICTAKGIRALTADERKPVMKDFFKK